MKKYSSKGKSRPPKSSSRKLGRAWVVDVNMGYGHQRTAYPLRALAPEGKIIHANDYDGISAGDEKVWETSRKFYEFISRFKRVPLVGKAAFNFFDTFQKILSFYPNRDLSRSNFQLKQIFAGIKRGWGRDLIEGMKKNPLPFLTTFFTPAFMAEFFDYPEDIYCVVCDADISRTWVPPHPRKSRMKYFTPNKRTTHRLRLYGVKREDIFFTGYPLPLENIGTYRMEILKRDLRHRILNLDPKKNYYKNYKVLVDKKLGKLPQRADHPFTVMFAVGGAGAQKEIAIQITHSLREKIRKKEVRLILVSGVRGEVREYFLRHLRRLDLDRYLGNGLDIIFSATIEDYFQQFNLALRKTDVLWTKPSELSFYTGLGLPILIAPTIGSQENFNREWLTSLGSGIVQEDPRYTHQWLFDFLESGRLAEAAMQGFIEAEQLGTFRINKIISQGGKL